MPPRPIVGLVRREGEARQTQFALDVRHGVDVLLETPQPARDQLGGEQPRGTVGGRWFTLSIRRLHQHFARTCQRYGFLRTASVRF